MRADVQLRISDLKEENPKRDSRSGNSTLIITSLPGPQFELRNLQFETSGVRSSFIRFLRLNSLF